jgi:hypothetical protein
MYARPFPPGLYGAKVKFGIEKLGVVCIYPCQNMLAIVCCGIPKVGAKPSMVVRLWKWFTDWAKGLGNEVSPTDAPLVCGLVWVKLTVQAEEELTLVVLSFFLSCYSINLCSSSSVLFAHLSNIELIMDSISLQEGDGPGQTSGVTSGLLKMIGVVSWRTVPYHVISQHDRKSSLKAAW